MTTSYKNQGAGYSGSAEIDQGTWQESGTSIGGPVTITANGTLTLTGWSNAQSGTVGITANGDLTCFGTALNVSGSVAISANGDVVVGGVGGRLGSVGISGNGKLVFPHKAWGSVGITANGTLTIVGSVDRTGVVDVSANGAMTGVLWKNQPVERVWMESKMVQGIVGISILKRSTVKWQT